MGKKRHKKGTKVAAAGTGPVLRWMVCGDGDIHVFGPCPRCFNSNGGWLLGTSGVVAAGITRARCADCGETVDYFVDPEAQQMWKAQAIPEPSKVTCAL